MPTLRKFINPNSEENKNKVKLKDDTKLSGGWFVLESNKWYTCFDNTNSSIITIFINELQPYNNLDKLFLPKKELLNNEIYNDIRIKGKDEDNKEIELIYSDTYFWSYINQ